jgi:tetratricopeptide (TPR) repeat protein
VSGREPQPEPEGEAWERAWAGDLAEARRLAETTSGALSSLGVLGVVLMLERRSNEALEVLDRALALEPRADLVLHRVRALVHLGRFDEATRVLASLGDGESFARRLLIARVQAEQGDAAHFRFWRRAAATSEVHLNGLFSRELPAVVGRAAVERAFRSPRALSALLEDVLDRMAGNLGSAPTFSEWAPDGTRRFVRIALPSSTRAEAVAALHALGDAGVADTEGALAELVARTPRSPHAHCYLGELYLWLGRYDAAWRSFVAARSIEKTRWADIGMLAALALTGRTWRARVAAEYAERNFPPVPGGTLPVYRGMLRRQTGDLDGAIDDFRAALAAKPTRVGARMELCLALRAAGRGALAAEHTPRILRDAAPILVDAAEAHRVNWRAGSSVLVSDAVLAEALGAMLGNRSSSVVTWVDRAGTLRVLPHPSVPRNDAAGGLDLGALPPFSPGRRGVA